MGRLCSFHLLLFPLVLCSWLHMSFAQSDVSNTILVTYRPGCLEEPTRSAVMTRSVDGWTKGASRSAREGAGEWSVRRSQVAESSLVSRSVFTVVDATGTKTLEDEGGAGCQIEESWLRHVGLQVITLSDGCQRFGKDEFMGRLGEEDCVLTREADSVRSPTDMSDLGSAVMGNSDLLAEREPEEALPNDPLFPSQWHLNDAIPYSVTARAAWDISTGGTGALGEQPGNTVGIVDFGFMETHPDLQPQWWTNPSERCDINGKNNIDEDSDGLVDDCNGWNFAKNSNDLSGWSHGTKVAGCAAAAADNGVGVAAVCRNCRILPATVAGSVSSELAGVNYVLSKGVRVINLSVGGPRSQAEFDTFSQNPDCLFVLSAGNEACDLDTLPATPCLDKYGSNAGYPAALSDELANVISVGAIQSNGVRSSFSNYGSSRVQVFAPGSGIYTTSYSGSTAKYSSRSGTSYAAPIVAGIAVLVSQKYPTLSPCQIREVLIQSCSENVNLLDKATCNGQVNASLALELAEAAIQYPELFECSHRAPSDQEYTREQREVLSKLKGDSISHSHGDTTHLHSHHSHSPSSTGTDDSGPSAKSTSTSTSGFYDEHGKLRTPDLTKWPVHGGVKPLVKKSSYSSLALSPKKHGVPSILPSSHQGELYINALLSAFVYKGVMVEAHLLEVVLSLLLKLFANYVDPLAILTEGKPVLKYLDDKRDSHVPDYGFFLSSRGPIDSLVQSLSSAKAFLDSYNSHPSLAPLVSPLEFGADVLQPLSFAAELGLKLFDVDSTKVKHDSLAVVLGKGGVLLDPLQLLIAKKQLLLHKLLLPVLKR